MRKAKTPNHACQVTGSRKATQFCLSEGFAIKTCIKLSIIIGKKSTTWLRSDVTVKSAAATSISLLFSCPKILENYRFHF